MVGNPFTPAFGGKPQHFFGRSKELSLMREALENENSPHRAMFITGTRGYGKTALLEQMSGMAKNYGWRCIDVHSSHAARIVLEQLVGGTQRQVEKSLEPQAFGVSAGHVSTSTISSFEDYHLAQVLVEACENLIAHKGIFITVDEIQKVPEADAENLCAAVQMAVRKGLPVILALAGLPGSKEKVSSYAGCTFMHRAPELPIGSLLVDETLQAFGGLLSLVEGLVVDDRVLWSMAEMSKGHPYLMQLVGYHLVESLRPRLMGGSIRVSVDDVSGVEDVAYASYRADVLEPALASLRNGTLLYLEAASRVMASDGRARTSDISATMGKSAQEVSMQRSRLISARLLVADGHGFVRFGLPYLRRYLEERWEPAPADPGNVWLF